MQFKRRLWMGLLAVMVLAAIVYGFIPRPVMVDAAANCWDDTT
jgi:hypothetical protein